MAFINLCHCLVFIHFSVFLPFENLIRFGNLIRPPSSVFLVTDIGIFIRLTPPFHPPKFQDQATL